MIPNANIVLDVLKLHGSMGIKLSVPLMMKYVYKRDVAYVFGLDNPTRTTIPETVLQEPLGYARGSELPAVVAGLQFPPLIL